MEEKDKEKKEVKEDEEELKALKEKVKKLEEVARVVNTRYVELRKEFESLQERYRKDLEEMRKFGYKDFALAVLEVMDNLERAFNYSKEGQDCKVLVEGIELTLREFKKVLERFGIKEIEILGKEFDPFLAEAVEKRESKEHKPNTVLEVIRKGYTLHGRVLRPARVCVCIEREES